MKIYLFDLEMQEYVHEDDFTFEEKVNITEEAVSLYKDVVLYLKEREVLKNPLRDFCLYICDDVDDYISVCLVHRAKEYQYSSSRKVDYSILKNYKYYTQNILSDMIREILQIN